MVRPETLTDPFVVIVGTQSSGSSAIAGVCYHLGLWMGRHLGGRYGNNPERKCGFEDRELTRLVKRHSPFLRPIRKPRALRSALLSRVSALQQQARSRGTIAGGKLPRLSFFGDLFREFCGPGLKLITCERPLEDAIKSVQRRMPRWRKGPAVQRWLHDQKDRLAASLPAEQVLRVEYYRLLADPRPEAERIAAFLGLTPTEEQYQKAVNSLRQNMRHVGKQHGEEHAVPA